MLLSVAAARSAAQTVGPRPAVVVLNLRFDGEHANVLSPGDTAVVAAATSKLLATLRASELVTLVDSSAVAAAGAPPGARGDPRGHKRRPPAGRRPRGPRGAARGTAHPPR